jgi:hypothetical protein
VERERIALRVAAECFASRMGGSPTVRGLIAQMILACKFDLVSFAGSGDPEPNAVINMSFRDVRT